MPFDAPSPHGPPSLEDAEVSGLGGALARTRDLPITKQLSHLAKLGDQEPLYAASILLGVCGLVLKDRRLVRSGVRVGAAVAASDVLKSLTKKLVTRSRPKSVAAGRGYRREGGGSDDKGEQSFPSGHVAATLAASRALRRVYPKSGPAGLGVTAVLGGSRVAAAEHWPSDILAGAVIGYVAEKASGAILDKIWAETSTRPMSAVKPRSWFRRG